MEPLEPTDKLIEEYSKSNEYGAWIGVWVFEDKDGKTYSVCQDQDGEEWIEE